MIHESHLDRLIIDTVSCPHCGAEEEKPCVHPNGMFFSGSTLRVHQARAEAYREKIGSEEFVRLWRKPIEEAEVLTFREAANYLQIGTRSLYYLARTGKIPCSKILNKYRFEKEQLREWVKAGGAAIRPSSSGRPGRPRKVRG